MAKNKAVKRRGIRALHVVPAGHGFWSGFVSGLGALTLLGAHDFNPPRYAGDSVASSWRAVGKEIRGASRRIHEQKA